MDSKAIVDFLNKKIVTLSNSEEQTKLVINELFKKYNVPYNISSDYISGRLKLAAAGLDELFRLMDVISPENINDYFLPIQIEKFRNLSKYIESENNIFKVVKINDDQYIGSATIQQIISLRNSGIIKYNEDTQRPMKEVVRNGNIVYQVFLNMSQVNEIEKSILRHEQIPTPLTFNIDETSDFEYDEYNQVLKFKTFSLDILDGFHRLIAMQKVLSADYDFDYNTEVRFVCFSKEKAQHFIYQEDQKTKMSIADSKSMNQYDEANQVCKKLCSEPGFLLKENIGRNNSKINTTMFVTMIRYFWFSEKRQYNRREIINTTQDIKNKLNILCDFDDTLFNKWDYETFIIVLYSSYNSTDNNIEEIYSKLKNGIDNNVIQSMRKGKSLIPRKIINYCNEIVK